MTGLVLTAWIVVAALLISLGIWLYAGGLSDAAGHDGAMRLPEREDD